MDEIKSIVNRTVDVLEQDNRGVQLGCYSVALVGLTIAIRKVRPFSKFRKPSDIPNKFITERKELTGVVERIDPNGAVLMVNHKPLIPLPGISNGQLPVKITGVKVFGFGLNWLQTIVVGNEVKFIPIAKQEKFLQCQVLLPQIQNNKTRVINVGESLVKIGFGQVTKVDKSMSNDRNYLTYCSRLQAAENYALKKKLGAKYYIKPTTDALTSLAKSFRRLAFDLYRHIIQIPKLPAS
ncbi:hypothetical protein Zmor_014696 [Zophobas morio]|uniref:Uncharacterized protein n=1 Tax=Zophobas morio TaxID=2755281 RepID=A0AA38ICY6_9CUCU|nr:hypothetical protein Zmor_020715 [Zophobas morio]KAJ3655573.1 hypothetical protein Zmor_014696 [Zophobas morio]